MRIAIAQLAPGPGDLDANERRILAAMDEARRAGANLLVTSGAALTGTPELDAVAPGLTARAVLARVRAVARRTSGVTLALGIGFHRPGALDVAIAADGRLVSAGGASRGPGGGASGGGYRLLEVGGWRFGVMDDLAFQVDEVVAAAVAEGARALLVVASSPFHLSAQVRREHAVAARARAAGVAILFVNNVGAGVARVWDGASLVAAADGSIAQRLPAWSQTVALCRLEYGPKRVRGEIDHRDEHNVLQALVLAVRSRVAQSGSVRVEVASGSGPGPVLALAAAVDAVGRERVVVRVPGARDGRAGEGVDEGVDEGAVRDRVLLDATRSLGVAAIPADRGCAPAAGAPAGAGGGPALRLATRTASGSGSAEGDLALLADIDDELAWRIVRERNDFGRLLAEELLHAPAAPAAPASLDRTGRVPGHESGPRAGPRESAASGETGLRLRDPALRWSPSAP
jgi:predicted amidohydrolase